MKKCVDYINKNKYIILLILLYIIFFIQMQQIFFYGDDYQVLYPFHNPRTFGNILNFCLEKMNWFWTEWSGRIAGHFTVSFGLSFFGLQFFKILNPIMVFLMIYLCLKILSLFKNFDFLKYLFFVSLVIIGLNIFVARETLYWAYAGILYIWGFNLTLLVVYFVYKYYTLNKNLPVFLLIILIICCLIQTFILEQLSFILISFLFIMLINMLIKRKNWKPIAILLVISMIGFITSTFAPGNVVRTEPLIEELVNYNDLHIVLGKILWFFNYILNPKICGIYFAFFALLVNKKYLFSLDKKKDSFLKKIPSIILISYFLGFLISDLFNINVFAFAEDSDTLYSMYSLEYLLSMQYEQQYNLALLLVIIRIIYFGILTISVLYMTFKTLWKENKFLMCSIFITLFAAIIPIVCIRFIGSRYFLFFIMAILMVSINYILNLKNKSFNLQDLLLYSFILPYKYAVPFSVLICILILMNTNIRNFFDKNINSIMLALSIFVLITNISTTIYGYKQNRIIYANTELVLQQAKPDTTIILNRISNDYKLYTWHSIIANFNEDGTYYGNYLNDFYTDYYNIDLHNIVIQGEYFSHDK